MRKFLKLTACVCLTIIMSVNTVSYGLDVSAKGAIVLNAQTNEIVFEKNAYETLPMASTTKIMTALLAIESGRLDETATISRAAASVEGSSMYLYEGENIKLLDLVYGLMLCSGNDAATAIAEHISGDKDKFVELMNKRAGELGLKQTHFMDPCGFYYKDHYTTAYDLSVLSSFALRNPTFSKIVATKKWQAGALKNGTQRWVYNHNRLLSSYEGANGVKTGYTIDSGRCLVSSAERDGVELVCVTLDCPNDWKTHQNMLDYGFSSITKNLLFKSGEEAYSVAVGGGDKQIITVRNTGDAFINTTQYNSNDVKITINLPKFLFAPVYTDKPVGSLVITYKGTITQTLPLYSDTAVSSVGLVNEKSPFEAVWDFIKNLLKIK